MKIMFLDIDGVLNSSRTALAYSGYGSMYRGDDKKLDPVALKLIQNLSRQHHLATVISSSWRIGYKAKDFDFLDLNVVDCTPSLSDCRGSEIKKWIDECSYDNISKYVIIDDSSDMLNEQLQNFVRVNPHFGFSHADYYKADEILRGY